MENRVKEDNVKEAFHKLSKTNKTIKLSQVKRLSGVEDLGNEIEDLKKRGIIIQLSQDEFIWV